MVPNTDNELTPRFKDDELNFMVEWFDQNHVSLQVTDDNIVQVITIEIFQKFLDLKKFHRRHFHYPTYAELMTEAETLKSTVFTKTQFLTILDKFIIKADLKHELNLAFKVFDTEKRDFLDIEEIKSIVTNQGDVFNNDEIIELLRDADVRGDGNVVYENFINTMFSLAPELNELKFDFLYKNPDEDPSVPPEPVVEEELPPPELSPTPPPPPPPEPAKKADKKKKK